VFVDFVRDSSDTELGSEDERDVQYEPASETEEEAPISGGSSAETEVRPPLHLDHHQPINVPTVGA
jgi:hypothetical protein